MSNERTRISHTIDTVVINNVTVQAEVETVRVAREDGSVGCLRTLVLACGSGTLHLRGASWEETKKGVPKPTPVHTIEKQQLEDLKLALELLLKRWPERPVIVT